MNKVILLGRVTREIIPTFTAGSGLAVSKFSVAVDRGRDKGADFINCIAFGKTGENVAQYFAKGDRILIEGHIQTGSYEKDGKKVYTTDVIVDRFDFIEKRGQSEGQKEADPFAKAVKDFQSELEPVDDSDIPF